MQESLTSTADLPAEDLNADYGRMAALAQQGFHCSEILLFMGLEAQDKTDPDLIRAVSALAGGIGFSGETCGALTGGACLLGLFAGRGAALEPESPVLKMMVQELVEWFSQKYGKRYGGIRCSAITEDNPGLPRERCPAIVAGVYRKARSLISGNGFKWAKRS